MTWFTSVTSRYVAVGAFSAALGFLLAWPLFATAQDKKDPSSEPAAEHAPPAGGTTETNKDLVEQIKQLNAKVIRLEATQKQGPKTTPSGTPDKGGPADKADGVPPGKRISAKFQNCIQCHQKRPSGPLPPSHLEMAGGSDKGATQEDKTVPADKQAVPADKQAVPADKQAVPADKQAAPADKTADANKELADQIRQLNSKVARLEAALKQDPKATPSGDMKEKGMGMGMKEKGMGMGMGMGMKEKGMGMDEKKGMPGMGGGKTGMGGSTTGTLDQQKIKMLELKMQMLELKMEMLEKGAGSGTDETAPAAPPKTPE